MRRSKSSSGIPLAKSQFCVNRNIFEAKTPVERQRSRSVTRCSSNVGLAPGLASASTMRRNPSLERCTPISSHMGKASYLRTPASITPRESGYRASCFKGTLFTHGECSTEKRITKKQLDDKKWIKQKFTVVIEFIQNSGLFDSQMASQIHPPTIKTVVLLFGTLFKQILPGAHVDPHKYAESILQYLKMLGYPGNITASTIKTANTLHGWDNFIAVSSWLVEKVSMASSSMNELVCTTETDKKRRLREEVSCLIRSNYLAYAPTQTISTDSEALEGFKRIYAEILDVDPNGNEIQRAELKRLEKERDRITTECEHLRQKNQEREEMIAFKLAHINKFKKGSNREEEQENQMIRQRARIAELPARKKATEERVKNLEMQVKTQPHSVKQKKQILSDIKSCERNKARRAAKIKEYHKIRDELDIEIHDNISELEKRVDEWNLAITKSFLPEMKSLRLRDKGFFSKSFLEEIKKAFHTKIQMKMAFEEEMKKIEKSIEQLKEQEEELRKSNERAHILAGEVNALKQEVQKLKQDRKEVLAEMQETDKTNGEKIKAAKCVANEKLAEQAQEIESYEKRVRELKATFQLKAMEGVNETSELYRYLAEKIVECQQTIPSIIQMKVDQIEQYRAILKKNLDQLVEVRMMAESIQQDWNRPLLEEDENE